MYAAERQTLWHYRMLTAPLGLADTHPGRRRRRGRGLAHQSLRLERHSRLRPCLHSANDGEKSKWKTLRDEHRTLIAVLLRTRIRCYATPDPSLRGVTIAFACKREATPIKINLSVPIAAGMVTA